MIDQTNRFALRNRYLFKGRLVMRTAFHIGGGKGTLSSSQSPVVLTPEELPFIPGSSFKGALRSIVEKLVPTLPEKAGLFSCGLVELSDEEQLKERLDTEQICSTTRPKYYTNKRRNNPSKDKEINQEAIDKLCHTCLLFGSPYTASRININDLYIFQEDEWKGIVELRDGVAIDRDSEKAIDGRKYDFEVVPASAAFDLEITLENVTIQDLQLISLGLSEYVSGLGVIGGKRSRGLGVCRLDPLNVYALELTGIAEGNRNKLLRNYLLNTNLPEKFPEKSTGQEFLNKHIDTIF